MTKTLVVLYIFSLFFMFFAGELRSDYNLRNSNLLQEPKQDSSSIEEQGDR